MPDKDGAKTQSGKVPNSAPYHQPSIKDIARLAHVSHPTVSRALHNSPLVNRQTAARIRRIAEDAGYRASAVARGLVTRQTRTIGLVVASLADPFTAQIACGIEQAAVEHGYAVLLSSTDAHREGSIMQMLSERRVDGILVVPSHIQPEILAALANLNVPIVVINGQTPGEQARCVMIDNVQGSRAVVKHLIGLGHRRIGYVGDRQSYQANSDRVVGYKKALVRAGIACDEALIAHGDGGQESAFDAVNSLLALASAPTAICCYSDVMALGALRAVRMRGLRVPEDISIAGFGDLLFSAYLDPPLTTVRQPMHQLGRMAVEILIKLLNGQSPTGPARIDAELIVRGSTGKMKDMSR